MNFFYDLFLTMHNIHMQHSCDLNVLFHTPAGVNDDNELSLLRGV